MYLVVLVIAMVFSNILGIMLGVSIERSRIEKELEGKVILKKAKK